MKLDETQRGFSLGKFKDSYGENCSIQKSSSAMDDFIWLGIDKVKEITIFENENKGKYVNTPMPKNWDVSSRMHLSRKQVEELLPLLQKFVETGELD